MTERYTEGPEMFLPPDPEIEAVSDKLRVVSEGLGFSERGDVGHRRQALLREINMAHGFDRTDSVHVDHLAAYQDAGLQSIAGNPNQSVLIGYHIAMARMWLEADDSNHFYDCMYGYEDQPDDPGVISMLRDTPGLEDTYNDVRGVIDYLRSLN